MEKFKISDIQELFTADVERFHQLTLAHVTQLLTQTPPPRASLEEALRQTHTLKGLAATVHAWGLSGLGTDYEKLLEVAGSWLDSERSKANEIFQFILDHQQDWFLINQYTCLEMLTEALDLYQSLRKLMMERWAGYLPDLLPAAATDQKSVRLTALDQLAAVPTAQPALPAPLRVVPPALRQRPAAAPAEADRDVRQIAPITPADAPAKPTPLQVVPPSLRRRKNSKPAPAPPLPPQAQVPAHENPGSATPGSQTPARPTPLEVVPPKLRRAEATTPEVPPVAAMSASAAPTSMPQITPAEQAQVAAATPPPLLRVAPPALKRRAVTPPAPHVPQPPVSQTPPDTNAPLAPVAPQPPSAAPAAFKPSADADLLDLLGQEVAGYLTELSEHLVTLAADLASESGWEKTRRLFHTIKGTAATFHLEAVASPAKAAEAHCLVATEDASARNADTFETCVQRAQVIAKALGLVFTDQPLRTALANGLAATTAAAGKTAGSEPAVLAVDPELAGFFIRDARDQIELIEQSILRWEKGESPAEQIWAVQRGFHTLKGAGNSIGLTAVAQSVHEVEAFLEGVAAAGATGAKAVFAFLFGAVDQLRRYLNDLAKNPATPWRHDWNSALRLLCQPAEARAVTPAHPLSSAPTPSLASTVEVDESHTLRVPADRLYELMNLIGEMVVDRSRLEKKIEQLTALHRALAERNQALTGSIQSFQQQFEFNLIHSQNQNGRGAGLPGRSGGSLVPGGAGEGEFSELEFDRYDQFNILARSLVEISHDIEELNEEVAGCLDSFTAENVRFTQTSQSLQSKVTNLSLVPVNTLFPRLQRAFRDALSVEHKEADLQLSGGEALLDKVVVDKIYAPLLHLLRNAVAHGIEDAVTREKLKKPARGQVGFSAEQSANQIVIRITDDGSGVNAAAVRQRAIEKGWLTADAPALTAEQVVHFIFQPGFSTASKVTSVSGRGIGLDVVRQDIENLNGSVELKYEAGQGATWTLRLPLTLSISEAILGSVGGTALAFPLNFIEAGLILEAASSRDAQGREFYPLGETPLPVLRLAPLLGLSGDAESTKGIIVSIGDRRAIVVVDRVLARQEIVIKHLDALTAQHPLLNGATLDAEGRVIPILNLPALLKLGEREPLVATPTKAARGEKPASEKLRVLIVDDSLSVRKVQERLLTELNCAVTAAKDGLNALEKLRESDFDIVFTDLEMPRMNGYELISDLRGNPIWGHLPIVVISSRGADKYITKAMNLGASTFLSKPFTQEQLQQVLQHYTSSNRDVVVHAA